MKKRILSLLMAMIMVFTMVPQVSLKAEAADYKVVMTAYEFIEYLKIAHSRKNVYDNTPWFNCGYYDGEYIHWDCWNLGKTIIWSNGDIVYNETVGIVQNPVEDTGLLGGMTGGDIVRLDPNYSSDFTNLVPGEWLYLDGHTGYYIGNGEVIECTPMWGANGITISQIDSKGNRSKDGKIAAKWEIHGKVPWLDYDTTPLVKKTYPSNCIVEVSAASTYIKSMACKETLDPNSTNVEVASKETQYHATKLMQNTEGELWYEVTAKNGEKGYLYAGDTVYRVHRTDDLVITDANWPVFRTKGYPFEMYGIISATYNELTQVSAYVYSADGTQITGSAETVSGTSKDLHSSTVNANTRFATVPVGVNTYVVSASYKNYYAKTSTTVGENTGTVVLLDATFKVAASQQSCTHAYSESVAVKATCIANGKLVNTCTKCSTSYSTIIPVSQVHDYTEKIISTANCTTDGLKVFTCKHCYTKYQETLPATGHNYKVEVKDPSCTEDGYTTYSCTCGYSYTDAHVAAKGHQYQSVVTQPTCTAEGFTTFTCSCGYSYIGEKVDATGHKYLSVVTPATCTEDGFTTHTCACGDSYVSDFVNSIGHAMVNNTCRNCGLVGSIYMTTQGLFTYQVINGVAMIVGCDKSVSGDLLVPSRVDGFPITTIATGVFKDCVDLETVTIPYSIEKIGDHAFEGCTALKSVILPHSVKELGDYIFLRCSALESIQMSASIEKLGEGAFQNCSKLKAVTIPSSITEIKDKTFDCCSSLTEVIIPENVTSIGYQAFGSCVSLDSVTIPDQVTTIEPFAFVYCTSLNSVKLPKNLTNLGNNAFMNCNKITSISIPETLAVISASAFSSCSGLTSITIPENVKLICSSAFTYCKNIRNISFLGNAPELQGTPFVNVEADVCYPGNNPSWTEDVMQQYGGTLNWIPHSGNFTSDGKVSCTVDGTMTGICDHCGELVTVTEPAHGHTYDKGVCILCGDVREKAVLTGNLNTYGDGTAVLILTAFGESVPSADLSAKDGTYSIAVFPGVYTLTVVKNDNVTRIYSIEVTSEKTVLNIKLSQKGDVSGDGKLTVGDVAKVYSHIKKTAILTDEYQLLCADVQEDGRINVGDTARIYSRIKGN